MGELINITLRVNIRVAKSQMVAGKVTTGDNTTGEV